MKISKRQLKRIIKEEKAKLLRESITDMATYENAFDNAASMIAGMFETDMMAMYDEDPDLVRGDRGDWEQQVVYAAQEIETGLAEAMRSELEMIERQLHDGQYDR